MDMMMHMEIIPNWHPILVHFTIALLSVSVVLFIAEIFVRKQSWHIQLVTVARWNLWLGALATIATVIAGIDAFNTVPHGSEEQHLAMLDHRKWALSTAALFLFLAVWSFSAALRGKADFQKGTNLVFVGLMIIAGLMLATTGYKGAELVYRHGLGVIPMQKDITGGQHQSHGVHGHNESLQENHDDDIPNMEMPDADESQHDHSTHQH
ncbi:MAG: DUF2231 domain-containing protein [Alphaproteobacteria bacterium]|nr:DUF2231 domain-containing protein [Alphaproteobacteria bacterium]